MRIVTKYGDNLDDLQRHFFASDVIYNCRIIGFSLLLGSHPQLIKLMSLNFVVENPNYCLYLLVYLTKNSDYPTEKV